MGHAIPKSLTLTEIEDAACRDCTMQKLQD